MRYLRALLALLLATLRAVLYGWILWLIALFRWLRAWLARCRRLGSLTSRQRKTSTRQCERISDPAFKRPDPLIYCQKYLMSQGIAVTWDNPDIELRRGGVPVPSSSLDPDTEYEVVARIWNNSTEAPVVGLPVHVSYLSFGMGVKSHPVADTKVNLGVKGGPNHPAYATVPWRTPATPGHYCLQVRLDWVDDVNPNNNLGQENTNVVQAHSPASFEFALGNDTGERQAFHFDSDTYTIPPQPTCAEIAKEKQATLAAEVPPRQVPGTVARVPERHDRNRYPLPADWSIAFDPAEPVVAPGEEITVRATVSVPDTFHGRQALNIHAFHRRGPAGGITVYIERS